MTYNVWKLNNGERGSSRGRKNFGRYCVHTYIVRIMSIRPYKHFLYIRTDVAEWEKKENSEISWFVYALLRRRIVLVCYYCCVLCYHDRVWCVRFCCLIVDTNHTQRGIPGRAIVVERPTPAYKSVCASAYYIIIYIRIYIYYMHVRPGATTENKLLSIYELW